MHACVFVFIHVLLTFPCLLLCVCRWHSEERRKQQKGERKTSTTKTGLRQDEDGMTDDGRRRDDEDGTTTRRRRRDDDDRTTEQIQNHALNRVYEHFCKSTAVMGSRTDAVTTPAVSKTDPIISIITNQNSDCCSTESFPVVIKTIPMAIASIVGTRMAVRVNVFCCSHFFWP